VVTLKTIAQEAGVSVSVVSAVINDSRYVRMSTETRARIEAIIARTGYVRNHSAVSLRTARTQILGLVIPYIPNPITIPLLDGVYAAAEEIGWVVLLGDGQRLASGSLLLERIMGDGLVDGTLVRPSDLIDPETFARLSTGRTPIVVLDETDKTDLPWLGIDEVGAARLATEHLLAHGHRAIGFLGGFERQLETHRRLRGVRQALESAGLALRPEWIWYGGQPQQEAYETARRMLGQGGPLPTALVVNNVSAAEGVLIAAHDAGLRVPEDLSLVAFHDEPGALFTRPALTAVRLPMYRLGYEGVRMFKSLIDDEPVVSRVLDEPPQLVVRESVVPPAR
jgi:DNA-binding LacI/PurR family transcriptional regulator